MPVAEVASRELAVALVGNPNTGKSTLFNRLTGVRQRVGNYPGVTVERKTGSLTIDGSTLQVADLPGTYSLAAASPDERVVVDALAGRIPGAASPDAVVCVVDATNIKRNLFLASQVADLGLPMVIALNLTDAAQEQGLEIDVALLSERLGGL
jgi:ferrous iron transport protein B